MLDDSILLVVYRTVFFFFFSQPTQRTWLCRRGLVRRDIPKRKKKINPSGRLKHGSLSSASIPAKRRPHIIHRSLRLTPLRLRLFITLLNLKLPVSLTAAEARLHVTEIHLSGSLHTDTRGARLAAMCSVSVPGSSSAHTINISKSAAHWHEHANTHSCHLVLLVSSLPHTHTLVSRSQKKKKTPARRGDPERWWSENVSASLLRFLVASRGHTHTHTHVVSALVYTAPQSLHKSCRACRQPPPSPFPCRKVGGWVSSVRVCARVPVC